MIHWEDPLLRFPRLITPTDFDWLGFVDLAGAQGGPMVTLELKRQGVELQYGQSEAFRQYRTRMLAGDWWFLVRHNGANGHVWAGDFRDWHAWRGGTLDMPIEHGFGCDQLAEFVNGLDPFGRRVKRQAS